MLRALRYVHQVKSVEAWPEDIKDGTIRRLRREGFLITTWAQWNVHPASNVVWTGSIRDKLSDKGKEYVDVQR